jgi:ribonucleoside-diphosphate reductase alpha chain
MAEALAAADTLTHRADFSGWHAVAGRGEHRLTVGALKTLALEVGMTPGAIITRADIHSA